MTWFERIWLGLAAALAIWFAWAMFSTRKKVEGHGFRCWMGVHKYGHIEMTVEKGMGFFGGPVTRFTGNCKRCKTRMSS